MAGRSYRAYGVVYALKPECALESETFSKLSTLAKLEKHVRETREIIARRLGEDANGEDVTSVEVKQMLQGLQRDEAKITKLREVLKEVLA